MEKTLTKGQLARQDEVDNAIAALINDLVGKEVEWDMEIIGDVREVIQDHLVAKGITTEMKFYPYIELK
jgi:hypothetical protein